MKAYLLSILDVTGVVASVLIWRWLTGKEGPPDSGVVAIALAFLALLRTRRIGGDA